MPRSGYKKLVTGDYQYRALNYGFVVQRFWHFNKTILLRWLAKFNNKDCVLDAGCGSGNLVFSIAKLCRKVIAVDMSQEAIKFVRVEAAKNSLKNIEPIRSRVEKLPLGNLCVDKIILFEVLEHCSREDIKKLLLEFWRVLKVDGELYVTVPNAKSIWPFLEWILDTFKLAATLRGEQHITNFSGNSLKSTFECLGEKRYAIVRIGSINHLSPLVSIASWPLAEKVFNYEMRYGGMVGPILYAHVKKLR